jgi:anti-sigma B factor antagonist
LPGEPAREERPRRPLPADAVKRPLDIDTVEREGAVIVFVEGEIDLATAPLFDEKLVAAEATGARTVIVDLERVSFMDSTGLKILIKHALAEANGGRVHVTPGSAQVRRLFEITGMLQRVSFVSPDASR